MIVGPDWIWLHVPKSGGTAAEKILHKTFGSRHDVVFDPVGANHPVIWHHSIGRRIAHDPSFDITGKRIIAGIRRLPDWILSRVHYEANRSNIVPTREQMVEGKFLEANGYVHHADRMLREFNMPEVDHWIRLEHMAADMSEALRCEIAEVPRVNENKIRYVRDISFWFTPAELTRLYESNPIWAGIEERIYGNLALAA